MKRYWHALAIVLLLGSTACGEQPSAGGAPSAAQTPADESPDQRDDAPTTLTQVDQGSASKSDGLAAAQPDAPKAVENLKQKISYMIGRDIGGAMRQRDADAEIDLKAVARGVTDGLGEEADKKLSYVIGLSVGANLKQDNQAIDLDQVIEGLRAASADQTNASQNYADGFHAVRGLKNEQIDIDTDTLLQGWACGLDPKEKAAFTDEQLQAAGAAFQQQMIEKQMAKQQTVSTENLAKAEAFLADNKDKSGVVTTASGLQYIVLAAGEGASPASTDRFKAHYHGTLLDGTVFDSSVQRNTPLELGVNEVIPAWTEALQLMKVGGKFKIFVHPKLGYGPQGSGPIPPNSLLIFEMELLGFEPAASVPDQTPVDGQ